MNAEHTSHGPDGNGHTTAHDHEHGHDDHIHPSP
jgi:hypothetical protein